MAFPRVKVNHVGLQNYFDRIADYVDGITGDGDFLGGANAIGLEQLYVGEDLELDDTGDGGKVINWQPEDDKFFCTFRLIPAGNEMIVWPPGHVHIKFRDKNTYNYFEPKVNTKGEWLSIFNNDEEKGPGRYSMPLEAGTKYFHYLVVDPCENGNEARLYLLKDGVDIETEANVKGKEDIHIFVLAEMDTNEDGFPDFAYNGFKLCSEPTICCEYVCSEESSMVSSAPSTPGSVTTSESTVSVSADQVCLRYFDGRQETLTRTSEQRYAGDVFELLFSGAIWTIFEMGNARGSLIDNNPVGTYDDGSIVLDGACPSLSSIESSIASSVPSAPSSPASSVQSSARSKDTAIVEVDFNTTGYAALYVKEHPEVKFDDDYQFEVHGRVSRRRIDMRYLKVVEEDTVRVWASGDTGWAAAYIEKGQVVITVSKFPWCRPKKVNILLTATRKDFRNIRFGERTKEQFDANNRFLASRYEGTDAPREDPSDSG